MRFSLNRLNAKERKEFAALKSEIFGADLFVVPDLSDPKQQRYELLMAKAMGCGRPWEVR